MKVTITYTEKWRRTVVHDIDDDELREWMSESGDDGEPTAGIVREFLEAGPEMDWTHRDYPGQQDLDEFDYLDIDEVEIPTAAELAAGGAS